MMLSAIYAHPKSEASLRASFLFCKEKKGVTTILQKENIALRVQNKFSFIINQ